MISMGKITSLSRLAFQICSPIIPDATRLATKATDDSAQGESSDQRVASLTQNVNAEHM